ncbi:MAG: hypothetical protein AAGF12_23090 [Myxococcota bacterium]
MIRALALLLLLSAGTPRFAEAQPSDDDGDAGTLEDGDGATEDTGDAALDAGIAEAGIAEAGIADAGAPDAELFVDTLPVDLRPDVELRIDPPETTTGNIVTLEVQAVAREGDELTVPRQSFDPFDLFDTDHQQEPTADGRVRHVFQMALLALAPGDYELQPIRIRVVTRDDTLGDVYTDAPRIRVRSVLGNEPDAQPEEATAPVEVLEEDYTLAWIGGTLVGLLVLAAFMFLAARWWLRREKQAPPPPPPRPAWEVAIEKLERLRATMEPAVAEGNIIGWADELSDTIREYLGTRYGFDGLESTTDEVLARLRRKTPPGIRIDELTGVLGDLDLVKFAKASPDRDHCQGLLDAGFRLVTSTRPSKSFADPPRSSAGGAA